MRACQHHTGGEELYSHDDKHPDVQEARIFGYALVAGGHLSHLFQQELILFFIRLTVAYHIFCVGDDFFQFLRYGSLAIDIPTYIVCNLIEDISVFIMRHHRVRSVIVRNLSQKYSNKRFHLCS